MGLSGHKLTRPSVSLHLHLRCLRAYDVPVVSCVCSVLELHSRCGENDLNYSYRLHNRSAVLKQLSRLFLPVETQHTACPR